MRGREPLVMVGGKVERSKRDFLLAHLKNGDNMSDMIRDGVDLKIAEIKATEKPKPPKAQTAKGKVERPEAPPKPPQDAPQEQQTAPKTKGRVHCLEKCDLNVGGLCSATEYPRGKCKKSMISWVRAATEKPKMDW